MSVMRVLTEDEYAMIPNLFPAIQEDQIEMVKDFVLRFPQFIDAKMKIFNGTMLMMAAYYGRLKILQLLLKHGADPEITNEQRYNAFIFACIDNRLDCIKYLLDYGVNLHQVTDLGTNAVIEATKVNRAQVLSLLFDYGADVNHQALRGETGLFVSSSWGHTECVRVLLDRGADKFIRDIRGKLPIEVVYLYIWNKSFEDEMRSLINLYP